MVEVANNNQSSQQILCQLNKHITQINEFIQQKNTKLGDGDKIRMKHHAWGKISPRFHAWKDSNGVIDGTLGSYQVVKLAFNRARNPQRPPAQRVAHGLSLMVLIPYNYLGCVPSIAGCLNLVDLVAYSPFRAVYEGVTSNKNRRLTRQLVKNQLAAMDKYLTENLYKKTAEYGRLFNAECLIVRPEVASNKDNIEENLSKFLTNLTSRKGGSWSITQDLNVTNRSYKRLVWHLANLKRANTFKQILQTTKVTADNHEVNEVTLACK